MKLHLACGAEAAAAVATLSYNAFQTPAWVAAVAAEHGVAYEFCTLWAETSTGTVHLPGALRHKAGWPIFEAMPMGGYSGWLSRRPVPPEQARHLYAGAARVRPWLKMTLTPPPILGSQENLLPWPTCPTMETHLLPLFPDPARMLAGCRKNQRTYLSKTSEHYAIEHIAGSPEAAGRYHRLYVEGSAYWIERPVRLYGPRFFEILAAGIADFWFARHLDVDVAAAIFLKGQREIFYFGSGTLRGEYPGSPMDALCWQAILHYAGALYETLNMGASGSLEGVRRFKEKFGACAAGYRSATLLLPWLRPTA